MARGHASVNPQTAASRPNAQGRIGRTAFGAYLVRRFGLMLVTLFGISVIIFVLLRLTPGNIADILFDAGGFVAPADKAPIENELCLHNPIPPLYVLSLRGPVPLCPFLFSSHSKP